MALGAPENDHERSVEWSHARGAGTLVRMDSLKSGDRFYCMVGRIYTYDRQDGASSGVHHVTHEDGSKTMFAGCAEVVKL